MNTLVTLVALLLLWCESAWYAGPVYLWERARYGETRAMFRRLGREVKMTVRVLDALDAWVRRHTAANNDTNPGA